MSITDELREYATVSWNPWPAAKDRLLQMCDRIDEAHKKACDDAWDNGYEADYLGIESWLKEHPQVMEKHGWVKLPKDADGEIIHVGDVLTDDAEFKSEGKVMRLMLEDEGWMVGLGCAGWTEPSIHEWHHYHAPTVEDVLREFADEMNQNLGMYTGEAIDADEWRDADNKTIAEYAAKLRLAGDAE